MAQYIPTTNHNDPTLNNTVLQRSPHHSFTIAFVDDLGSDQTIPPLTTGLLISSTAFADHSPIDEDPPPFAGTTLHPPGDTIVRCTKMPGMGLPIELYLYILTFLAHDAVSLLACALTCTRFRGDAERMIRDLHTWTVDPSGNNDLNELLEGIRYSRYGRIIRILRVGTRRKAGTPSLFPRALSVIPLQLSRQLPSLRELVFQDLTINPQPCPSRWILYGRAFSSVTTVTLEHTRFPLFGDVISFTTSFPAVSKLHLDSLSCVDRRIPSSIMRNTRKLTVVFETLEIRSGGSDDGYWFQGAFIQWLVRRNVQVRGMIDVDTMSPKYIRSPVIADHHHGSTVRLTDIPGMGLPIEPWKRIIDVLSWDAMSLLACALTCRFMCNSAKSMLENLKQCTINATQYDGLNCLIGGIRGHPKNGKAPFVLEITAQNARDLPVALPLIPIRLSQQLTSLHELRFRNITANSQTHMSTWTLYGRAFSSVTQLGLHEVHFPSFEDFVALITSFPTLTLLRLVEISCHNNSDPFSCTTPQKCQKKQLTQVQDLEFWGNTIEFTEIFWRWIVRTDSNSQLRRLYLDEYAAATEGVSRLLSHNRKHIQYFGVENDRQLKDKEAPRLWLSKYAGKRDSPSLIHYLY
ncbi:hypothetical protein NLI96_g3431 [Meripilus lineatus]|uniref:F-box domain-containing protein n=1 Tax=Meripilus lineatus TaxID=2056292 RepID=A0AAD5YFN8_9APHY|nr:hypothetical protein NLI96_g3431 [Physisporinus lineatus]